MRSLGFSLRLVTAVVLFSALVSATDYERNAEIPLYANKIGPYHNPSEQYEYYTIPICEPKDEERKWHNLGEAIGGDRLVKTRASRVALLALPMQCLFTLVAGFKIQFRKPMVKQPLCDMMLKRDEVLMLKEAIRQDYFFEMFFDDLPVWG
jgi:transmembrane 9 superfamily protein 1